MVTVSVYDIFENLFAESDIVLILSGQVVGSCDEKDLSSHAASFSIIYYLITNQPVSLFRFFSFVRDALI